MRFGHSRFEIIRHDNIGDATKEFEGPYLAQHIVRQGLVFQSLNLKAMASAAAKSKMLGPRPELSTKPSWTPFQFSLI